MAGYINQTPILVAVDCIVFGFDGQHLKLLIVKRGLPPMKGHWSLLGGFVQPRESLEEAAARVLEMLTGLSEVYLEQLHAFSLPNRDSLQRTVSIAFFALLDLTKYTQQLSPDYEASWMDIDDLQNLIFDHNEMVALARQRLRYKASHHPILFELMPAKFTLPQIHQLFESIFQTRLDKRNFSRKLQSTGLLTRMTTKDKSASKKGAFYYRLNRKSYQRNFQKVLRFIPNPNALL